MNPVILAVAVAVVAVMAFIFWKFWQSRSFVNAELRDVVSKCREIESKCKNGLAVFRPDSDEEYLYETLVIRGVFKHNPFGGYSFTDGYEKTWGGVPEDHSVVRDYHDDDGVLVWEKNKEGVMVPVVHEKDVIGKVKKPVFFSNPKTSGDVSQR